MSYSVFITEHVVIKSAFDWRSIAKVTSIDSLHSFAEDVCRRVPKYKLAFIVVKLEQG